MYIPALQARALLVLRRLLAQLQEQLVTQGLFQPALRHNI